MLFFVIFASYLISVEKVFYNLNVEINPNANHLFVSGFIEFEKNREEDFFYLNNSLNIKKTDLSIKSEKSDKDIALYKVYEKNAKKFKKIHISYEGSLNYPIEGNDSYARGIKTTKGLISSDGCFLTEKSGWYPMFEDKEIYFDIKFYLPKDYDVVMPGIVKEKKKNNEKTMIRYSNKKPIFEITMVCSKYKVYESKNNKFNIQVYMINPDDELAKRYIEYSTMYLDMYEKLIGDYPYEKFAVVENFWETGYAFPSFTLLGKNVMRFPFIFVTSLPHEILHNWWGNGVYVDYDKGNWSEGLTTYLADYMFSEQRGRARDYRMNVLKKYTEYVKDDILLKDFKERHSNETEAIGYGKSMMLFHMIRKDMGDKKFIQSLKDFYKDYLYKKASWDELKKYFEKYSRKNYSKFFDNFVYKSGFYSAVLLKDSIFIDNNFLNFSVLNNGLFEFNIPLRLYYKNRFEDLSIELKKGLNYFALPLREKIFAICLDCEFDVLRKLSQNETPVTFSKLISANNIEIFSDIDLRNIKLFSDKTKKNGFESSINLYVGKKYVKDLEINDFVSFNGGNLIIQNNLYDLNENQFAFIFNKDDKSYAYLLCDQDCEAILNKIFHYGKYSYLIFDKNLTLIDSGVWELKNRDNFFKFDDSYNVSYEKRKPLKEYVSFFKEENIKKHIKFLSNKIKTRHPGSDGLNKAKIYIQKQFKDIGLEPLFETSYEQQFNANILGSEYKLSNICGKTGEAKSYVVISAHYDHLFPQNDVLYPGANDNASGVSALIELAKKAKLDNKDGLIFCAFSGEEYGRIGSKYFLENSVYKIYANVNIDTIGRLYDNDILVLNSETSLIWPSILKKVSLMTGINYKASKAGIPSSDDYSFIESKIPSIQFYDGSFEDYHKPTDTFSKIDFNGVVKFLDFIKELVYEIRKRDNIPFHYKKNLNEIIKKRTFSLGFAPDFEYNGEGLKIKKINSNSILLNYGFKDGDVILAINGIKVRDIFEYTNLLNEIDTSQPLYIDCLCAGKKLNIEISIK